MSFNLEQFLSNIRQGFQPQAVQIPQIPQVPQAAPPIVGTDYGALIATMNRLDKTIRQHMGVPVLLLEGQVALNSGTEDAVLWKWHMPKGFHGVLSNIDFDWTTSGSYKIRCRGGAMGSPMIFISDRATDLNYNGDAYLQPNCTVEIVQGATLSGTGNVQGIMSGRIWEL